MISTITQWFRNHEKVVLVLLVVVFIVIRLPGTSLPLHQDEYKWPKIVNPAIVSDTEIPHPPLSQFVYRVAGAVVGYDVDFRFVPLTFGVVNVLLLYYLLRMRFGRMIATVGSVFFTLSFFSVLASLMVDTDGQIMPFFFLSALIAYYKVQASVGRKRLMWLGLLLLACLLGFFIKVSFVLAIAAIIADYIWSKRTHITRRDIVKYGAYGLGGVAILIICLILAQSLFSFFNLSTAVAYWEHFIRADRNWMQTAIQFVKVILYLSPFLCLSLVCLSKERRHEVMPFLFYLIFGCIFYLILFDFSIGALDRYLQFAIIPLCVTSAIAVVTMWKSDSYRHTRTFLVVGSILAIVVGALMFFSHSVPALHPKAAWISRVLSFKWNFLYPFSGGSGPLGFYMSFLFLAVSWIISLSAVVIAFFKSHLRAKMLLVLIPLSLVYNLVFIEEYMFGNIYGSASGILPAVTEFIKNDPSIQYVTVYNDNGGNEIQEIGKYRKRLYTDPAFDINEKITTLNTYKEHYLEINVPRIDPASVYRRYLDSCKVVYQEIDRSVSATVYDCRGIADVKR